MPAAKARRWDRLRRWVTARRVVQAVLFGGLVYVAVPLISELPAVLKSLGHASPLWLATAGLFTIGGFFSAAWALRATAGLRIPMATGARLQVVAVFTGVSTPAS